MPDSVVRRAVRTGRFGIRFVFELGAIVCMDSLVEHRAR
jgi:hypothetical protein